MLAANGSSAVGGCSNITLNLDGTSTCHSPTSSVLLDGVTPILNALDGGTWADQYMILYTSKFGYSWLSIDFDFSLSPNFRGVNRIEVTIFNCPQWGHEVKRISVHHQFYGTSYSYSYNDHTEAFPTVASCNSLLKVCIPQNSTSERYRIRFTGNRDFSHRVYIAEVAFYRERSPCPPFTTIPGNWTWPEGKDVH